MKKIHITESQLEYLANTLNEADVDITPDKGESLSKKIQTVKTDPAANTLLKSGRATLNGDAVLNNQFTMEEGYMAYTKNQLKEARRRKLTSESRAYSKKDFFNNFR